MTRTRILAGALALAGLLLASGFARAAGPEERAAARQQMAQRISGLQDRIAQTQADSLITKTYLQTARLLAAHAQKLSDHGQATAAQLTTESAERFLARAEGKTVQQLPTPGVIQ